MLHVLFLAISFAAQAGIIFLSIEARKDLPGVFPWKSGLFFGISGLLIWISYLIAFFENPVPFEHFSYFTWYGFFASSFLIYLFNNFRENFQSLKISGRRAEKNLRETIRGNQALIDSAHDSIYTIDPDLKVTSVNQFAANQLKRTPNEICGKKLSELFQTEDSKRLIQNLQQVFQTCEPKYTESKIEFPNGAHWLDTRLIPMKNEEGDCYAILGVSRDISERKNFESALQKSEEKYRMVIEKASEGIFVYDQHAIILEANQRGCEIYGYSKEELIGAKLYDLTLPELRQEMGEQFQALLKNRPLSFETRHLRKDGAIRQIEFSGVVIHENQVLGILRDITEKRKEEEILRFASTSVDHSGEAIFWVAPNAGFVHVNRAACRFLGYSLEELLEMSIIDIDPNFKMEDWPGKWEKYKKPGGRIFETLHKNKRGEIFPVEIHGSVIEFSGKEYLCAFSRDISERKAAREALALEKERLVVTLRGIGEAVVSTDIDGNILIMNPAAEKLSGVFHQKDVPKKLNEVFAFFDHSTKEPITDLISWLYLRDEGQKRNSGIMIIKQGSRERLISALGSLLRDRNGIEDGAVFVFHDITVQRKLEEDLLRSQKLESIGVLAGGIAHDFNNILTIILGNISLAIRASEKGQSVIGKLQAAEKGTIRARDLTQQLLTFSRGGAPVKKAASIAELVKESAEFVLRGSDIKCFFQISKDLWLAEIDESQISRVIGNLAINARHAQPNGGRIFITAENFLLEKTDEMPIGPGKYIRISVKDEGIGIPPDVLPRVFEPYFSTKDSGSGLGLAISYSIINRHNGHIAVQTELNQGTTFSIYLPASNKKITKKTLDFESTVENKGKILVMDDEEDIRLTTCEILSHLGFEVDSASDGFETIEKCKKQLASKEPFQAVIIDLTIPGGMGGQETIRRLLEIDPNVKAIVSSGYSNASIMADFKDNGFVGMISKPFRIEDLQACLEEVLSTELK